MQVTASDQNKIVACFISMRTFLSALYRLKLIVDPQTVTSNRLIGFAVVKVLQDNE